MKIKMRVLLAFERSAKLREEFRSLGHDAWSCDLQESAIPGQHIRGDVFKVMDDGWDMMIAHPPCTDLACSGAKHFAKKQADGRQQRSIELFMRVVSSKIPKWAVENPVGIMSRLYRAPDQIVQPWMFGDSFQKTTCLWLNNLPPLFHWSGDSLFGFSDTHVSRGEFVEFHGKDGKVRRLPKWYSDAKSLRP